MYIVTDEPCREDLFKKSVCSTPGCPVYKLDSSYSVYDGANLPASGIKTCDTLTVSLQKLDNVSLTLLEEINKLKEQIQELKSKLPQ